MSLLLFIIRMKMFLLIIGPKKFNLLIMDLVLSIKKIKNYQTL